MRKGTIILNLENPPARIAIYSESPERRFIQNIVENKTAIGRERATKVREMLPTKETIKLNEIFLVTNNSVSLNNSNVNKNEIKNKVLTTKGRTNCAARYLCNKSFID
jgi:hypothetical protein